jgi:hypothetical protein
VNPTASTTVSGPTLTCASGSITGSGADSCTVSLATAAPAGGVLVSLSSNNAAVTLPATVHVPAQATSAAFTATAALISTTQTAMLTASTSAGSETFNLQLNPPTAAAPTTTPTLSASSASVSFGSVQTGQSATLPLTISSTGTSPVTISAISVAGSTFSATGITVPATLNPGQSATVTLGFSASAVNAYAGALTISSDSSQGDVVVNLSAAAIAAPPAITPPAALRTLSCSSSTMTGSGTDACTVSLTAAAPSGGLAVSLASSTLAVTVPASITVPASATSASFSAAVAAVATAETVTLTASAGGASGGFALQLSSAPTIALSANATSVTFGNVALNSPATQSITLTSTGTGAVVVSAISITGTGFAVSGATVPLTLQAGQTATINLQFDPKSSGAASGQLTITSDATSNSTIGIGLNGTGSSYSVSLTWAAPSGASDQVVGYNIYRATGSSSTYVKLNSSVNAPVVFSDATVATGASYDYYVTSVDSSGNESVPSNTATLNIP